jgi:ribonuclease HI
MKRTVLTLVDFKRAFDTVWKKGLYHKMLQKGIPVCFVQWTKQFLKDRYAQVRYGVASSGYKRFDEGLPQGAVTSPLLFLCYIDDIEANLPQGVGVSLFADDLALWTQATSIEEAEEMMQEALDRLAAWSKQWKLEISVEKTEVVLFTNAPLEAKRRPQLQLHGQPVNFNATPTFLGVTFDRQLTFNAHIDKIKAKLTHRAKVLGALNGRSWGCWKDDLRLLYLSYVRAAADYCAAAWGPCASDTQLKKIEVAQNAAARVITGCTSHTPTDDLLMEAQLMPFRDRVRELAATAYEKSLRLPVDNPRRDIAQSDVRARIKKKSWRSVAQEAVSAAGIAALPREALHAVPVLPPWATAAMPTFRTMLKEPIRRSDPVDIKRRVAQHTIDDLSEGAALDVYTDGSAQGSNRKGGAGALIIDKANSSEYELLAPAGEFTSSYRAEMVALATALKKVSELQDDGLLERGGRVNIFTDSKSAIERLSTGHRQLQELPRTIWSLLEEIAGKGNDSLVFQWVPGHSEVIGNERVDEIAKRASELDQTPVPIDYVTAKTALKGHCAKRWQNRMRPRVVTNGAISRGGKMDGLSKAEQTLISRLRTGGYTPQLAWYRWFITRTAEVPESPTCPHCGTGDEDLNHLLRVCPAHDAMRALHLEGNDPVETLFKDPAMMMRYLRGVGIRPNRM